MSKIVVKSLNQKFELRTYTVYFHINDSLAAEEALDSIDRASSIFKQIFNISEEPQASLYLVKSEQEMEEATNAPVKVGEVTRIIYDKNAIFLIVGKQRDSYAEAALTELAHMYFNNQVRERELKVRQWRSPSWIREGFALQAPYKLRRDSREWLQNGWKALQSSQKANQLIKPGVMEKDIKLIPDPNRRQLAMMQSFYMVRLLLSIYCDSFFSKYSIMMSAIDDMGAETCFRQITSFDFDKFHALFCNWVKTTDSWTAME